MTDETMNAANGSKAGGRGDPHVFGDSDDFTVGGIAGRPSREPFGPESPRTSTVRAEPCDCANDGAAWVSAVRGNASPSGEESA